MPAPADAARCAQHRRRPSVARCTACDERVCTECLVHTPVGIKCTRCTSAPPARGGQRRSQRGTAALVVGALVVAGVAFALLRGGQPQEAAEGPPGTTAGPTGETDVVFTGAEGLRLGGTLRLPDGAPSPVPGVVIIPGFGPTTRDGVAPPVGMPDRLYEDLSGRLAEVGVASLRYDKRGTGESRLEAGEPLEFEDMVADAEAAYTFLSERAEVDPQAVGLVGHDEGGLTALRVAGSDRRVAAVTLISTPGRPLDEVLADDLVATADDPAHGEEHADELRAVVAELRETGELPEPGELPAALRPVFPPDQEAYLRAIFSLDPAEDAEAVGAPVLIVRGAQAPGVSAEDADRLEDALAGDTDVLVGAESGHTLALVGDADGGGGTAVTGDRDHDAAVHGGPGRGIVRDDELLDQIAGWVASTLGAEPATVAGDASDDVVTIRIAAENMAFDPDEHHLPEGRYRFVLVNDDDVEHELQLAAAGQHHTHLAGVGPVAPGDTDSFVVELEAGAYEFACHLPGHFEAGMLGTVTVR